MAKSEPDIEQISLSLSVERKAIAPASAASKARQDHDVRLIQEECLAEFGEPPGHGIHERLAPFNLCLSKAFATHVRDIHRLLDRALIDVIERWFTDHDANMNALMPLERHEEDLLRWIHGPGSELVRPFREKYGMWRTDYLVEGDLRGKNTIKVCEINARIPFNGVWLIGCHGEAYKKDICGSGVQPFGIPDDFETTKKVIFSNFDSSKPLFHVHDKWPGVDAVGFLKGYAKSSAQRTTHVKPVDLRLQPDPLAPAGYKLLYHPCDGTQPEEIHQCSLELFQEELEDVDPILLRKLATCCLNDFRTVLFVHDKRILGVVLDQLDTMVKRKVFSEAEATRLQNGIAETLLPGTPALQALLEASKTNSEERKNWIAKPARDASCHGIQLGEDMTQEAWLALLEEQAARRLRPNEGAFVIQRMAKHVWFPIVRHIVEEDEPQKFHLIGSHHVVNSTYNMFGPWRIGNKIHAGVTGEGQGIVMSTVLRPDDTIANAETES